MYSFNIWHKLNILGKKVVLLGLGILLYGSTLAQSTGGIYNPRYDERKIVTYGFSLGFQSTSYRLKYSDFFLDPAMDSVHSILPKKRPGFKLGFIVNFKLAEYLDLRITPTVSFAEYILEYNFVGGNQFTELVESTGVEFPVLFKYKSQRRNNLRMYLVGGITPIIEASGKSGLDEDLGRLQIEKFNANLEVGFGLDMYYPLFKFSPEVRFAYGLVNVLSPVINAKSIGIDDLRTKTLSIYFHFQ
jgi:outer membrane protein with beta-barrel domain